jgi:hypothetical protein
MLESKAILEPESARSLPFWCGWFPVLLMPLAVVVFTPANWPRWALMWLLAFVLFAGCKWLTWRRTPATGLPWWQHAGYLLAWPGLDAKAFLRPRRPLAQVPTREWLQALAYLLTGAVLFWGVSRLVHEEFDLLLGWIGMIGVLLMLHFGSFHLLSCAWRAAGIEARPLMHRPLASVSVSEFWGKRWNTAFRDLTHRFLFRPLTAWWGPRWAIVGGFAFSGLIHDLVISVPAEDGYGWPTLFFLLQVPAILAERSPWGKRIGLGRGVKGWLFTMLVLALPLYGLFHPPFIRHIVRPCMRAAGAG